MKRICEAFERQMRIRFRCFSACLSMFMFMPYIGLDCAGALPHHRLQGLLYDVRAGRSGADLLWGVSADTI